ncbi:dipeptidase [Pseudotabrizicola sp. L79]|uniref:dipeptidase n=1 Tax=Pseudotabrizicola sp. L79 TaxID=3118402 RepID=UPI002F944F93
MTPIFDGHNDILLRLRLAPEKRDEIWLTGEGKGHLDLPRMQAGGFVGGFFAIYLPSPVAHDSASYMAAMETPPYSLPLPDLITAQDGLADAFAEASLLLWMERAANGAFKLCRTAAEVRACIAQGVIAGIMHMEGAEAIDEGLDSLHAFHAMGLRSLGPVWSRPTIFGHGVPFAYPASPDTGPGLTDAGKRLVRECNRLKIMIDLSHMNEAGFNDVAALSDAPLVATHSNAHALCPSSRNLTDRQLDMIRDSGGMVGLNYAVGFLNADGRKTTDCGWQPMLRHLDYLIDRLGEDHVGLGSDFDGAEIPDVLGDVAGLPRLVAAMQAHGYDQPLIAKICHENWLATLDRSWGG